MQPAVTFRMYNNNNNICSTLSCIALRKSVSKQKNSFNFKSNAFPSIASIDLTIGYFDAASPR